jgi:predicted RNase H-like HicB family nuclease
LIEAKQNITEAITAYIESLEKDGEKIPEGSNPLFVEKVEYVIYNSEKTA